MDIKKIQEKLKSWKTFPISIVSSSKSYRVLNKSCNFWAEKVFRFCDCREKVGHVRRILVVISWRLKVEIFLALLRLMKFGTSTRREILAGRERAIFTLIFQMFSWKFSSLMIDDCITRRIRRLSRLSIAVAYIQLLQQCSSIFIIQSSFKLPSLRLKIGIGRLELFHLLLSAVVSKSLRCVNINTEYKWNKVWVIVNH